MNAMCDVGQVHGSYLPRQSVFNKGISKVPSTLVEQAVLLLWSVQRSLGATGACRELQQKELAQGPC